MYNISVEIGNVTVTGPLTEVAKFLGGSAKMSRKIKIQTKAPGRPKKKRTYTKRSSFWTKKGG